MALLLHRDSNVTRRRQTHDTIPVFVHADPQGSQIAGAQLEAYGVLSELAHGGMSTVYLGEELATGARVAIKALDAFYLGQSDMVLRLLGEHELARRVCHPGLVEIRCAAQTRQGVPYLVMEYIEGESLGALSARRSLTIAGSLAIAAQIASALAALHAAGIVHCDVKPDNVLVLDEPGPGGWPRVKVIDYGVARLVDEPAAGDGSVVGTPAFMPPEQWHGAPTPRSDVYALGCVLYELITATPVFAGSLPQLMVSHCERLPERPSVRCRSRADAFELAADPRRGLEPRLDRLIMGMLAKDPALRPAMTEVVAELCAIAPAPRSYN